MATGGEVPDRLPGSAEFEHLGQQICKSCLNEDNLTDAVGLCIDCKDYLCLKCFGDHKVQQHRMLDRQLELQGQIQANKEDSCSDSCLIHENEVIQYYCLSHCHLGCKSCIQLEHAACGDVHYIPHVSKELVKNEEYKHAKIQLKSVLNTFLHTFLNVKRNSEDVDKSCADALRELQDFKGQIGDIVEHIERELVEKAQTLRLQAEQELSDMRKAYKAAHGELQSSLAKIEVLQDANKNCSSYIEMMRTKEKIESLKDQTQKAGLDISYRQSPIRFIPNGEILELLRNPRGFGTVSSASSGNVLSGSDEVSVLSDTDTGSAITWSDDFTVLSHNTDSSFSDDISVITDTGSRISQPSLRTGNVQSWLRTVTNSPESDTESTSSRSAFETSVITDTESSISHLSLRTGNNQLRTVPNLPEADKGSIISSESVFGTRDYNAQDIHVKTYEDGRCAITGVVYLSGDTLLLADANNLRLTTNPWDITSIGEDAAAVTIPRRHKIALVSLRNSKLAIDERLDVCGECWGVDYKNGKLAVSFCDPDKVQILNFQGIVLHSLGEKLLNYPYYLAFGQNDQKVYVSNYGSHNVVCVKMNGKIVATYRDTDLRNPMKAVVDSIGNVFVCAKDSKTVHQITNECKKLRVLPIQTVGMQSWPYSLCLSEEEDKLFVGMRNSDYVKVYRTGCDESL